MSARKNISHQSAAPDFFERVYQIKGDGIAVLKPERLCEEAAFVERIRRYRAFDIARCTPTSATEVFSPRGVQR